LPCRTGFKLSAAKKQCGLQAVDDKIIITSRIANRPLSLIAGCKDGRQYLSGLKLQPGLATIVKNLYGPDILVTGQCPGKAEPGRLVVNGRQAKIGTHHPFWQRCASDKPCQTHQQ